MNAKVMLPMGKSGWMVPNGRDLVVETAEVKRWGLFHQYNNSVVVMVAELQDGTTVRVLQKDNADQRKTLAGIAKRIRAQGCPSLDTMRAVGFLFQWEV